MSTTVYQSALIDGTNTELVQLPSGANEVSLHYPQGSDNRAVVRPDRDGYVAVPAALANILRAKHAARTANQAFRVSAVTSVAAPDGNGDVVMTLKSGGSTITITTTTALATALNGALTTALA